MPLAPGIALQNGHYVVDALLDAAPNGSLYWATHVVTGMRVFLQTFPLTEPQNEADLSALTARLEGISFSQHSPFPKPFQLFQEDFQTVCLAMGTGIGLPWSSASQTSTPLCVQKSLEAIRHIVRKIHWLQEQGISHIDLSPNRVWFSRDGDRMTLTGLPLSHMGQFEQPAPKSDRATIQSLAQLLYGFLTGESVEFTQAHTLKASLSNKLPSLSPLIVQAICQGIETNAIGSTAQSLPEWLAQLPDASSARPISAPHHPLMRRPDSLSQTHFSDDTEDRSGGTNMDKAVTAKPYVALMGTALFAAIVGVALGGFWRLNAATLPGAVQFDPSQSFPSQSGWSGDDPEAALEQPFIPTLDEQDTWLDSEAENPPQEELWDAPASASELSEDLPPVEQTNVDITDDRAIPEESFVDIDEFEDTLNTDPSATGPSRNEPSENEMTGEFEKVPQDFSAPPIEQPREDTSVTVSGESEVFPQDLLEMDSKANPSAETTSES